MTEKKVTSKTRYKFKECEYEWKMFFLMHESCLKETICSWLCNKTLSEIYRLLISIPDAVYSEDFEFYRSVQEAVEYVATIRKFNCFDKNPPEVTGVKIKFWEF